MADSIWFIASFPSPVIFRYHLPLKHLKANAVVATVLGSIPASSDTVDSVGRQMKQGWISFIKKEKSECQVWIFEKKITTSNFLF
jgi:hypothetical protein